MTLSINSHVQSSSYVSDLYKSNIQKTGTAKTEENSGAGERNYQDIVTISHQKEVAMTYESSLVIQSGDGQDQYNMLRGLVANLLKEQGIELQIDSGDGNQINFNEITPDEAAALVADDGYFGIEKTSDRIVDFAIATAGGDPGRLDAIKKGVEQGFNEAKEAFNGWLPDISYDTYDAVMSKLDAWAEANGPEGMS